jgi:hypothetical protein
MPNWQQPGSVGQQKSETSFGPLQRHDSIAHRDSDAHVLSRRRLKPGGSGFFPSMAEVFSAIVAATMRDEEELARTFVDAAGLASDRLTGMVLALHRRKLERFGNDPEFCTNCTDA